MTSEMCRNVVNLGLAVFSRGGLLSKHGEGEGKKSHLQWQCYGGSRFIGTTATLLV